MKDPKYTMMIQYVFLQSKEIFITCCQSGRIAGRHGKTNYVGMPMIFQTFFKLLLPKIYEFGIYTLVIYLVQQ
jgi:hypothetical protein